MKNRITLLIASVLLVLCVIQKEARYGTAQTDSVEKLYKSSPIAPKDGGTSEPQYADELLTDSQTFEFATADSLKSQPAARLVNQRLLQISAGSKLLNY
ncbi:hypothetical protein SAMN04487996_114157 [Dyadobacter soli]|uniref:Uncharacterized protein n=1 Tax=Dyadobacter soli TaxID=659014 RepID=A0A1G7QUI3_9BACT|nr:hypothetical protein [Dyadobacter soli]SDG02178.1 hypothetical protein SAMN04487996_114157 [Dyadobacter soli]